MDEGRSVDPNKTKQTKEGISFGAGCLVLGVGLERVDQKMDNIVLVRFILFCIGMDGWGDDQNKTNPKNINKFVRSWAQGVGSEGDGNKKMDSTVLVKLVLSLFLSVWMKGGKMIQTKQKDSQKMNLVW